MKKVTIIEEKCIFCGQCQAIAPEVFKIEDTAEVLLDTISEELIPKVQDSIDSCPTDAIEWIEDNS